MDEKLSDWQKYVQEQTGKKSGDIADTQRYIPRKDTPGVDRAKYTIQRKISPQVTTSHTPPAAPAPSQITSRPTPSEAPDSTTRKVQPGTLATPAYTPPVWPPAASNPNTPPAQPQQKKSRQPLKPVFKSQTTKTETREQLLERLVNPTVTLEEAALIMGVCKATVRRYTDRGILPHLRTAGNQRRFKLNDIIDFLENQKGDLDSDESLR